MGSGIADLRTSMRIHDLYKPIFKEWRAKRFAQFRSTLGPKTSDRVLDIGGYPHTWTSTPQEVEVIECLNLKIYPWLEEKDHPGHRVTITEGNACDLPYADKAFTIVFSNSVIEHVGDLDAQKAFAREARRVGGKLWIQTPAFACPVEPHYLTPFMHWLPKELRRKLARHFTVWGILERPNKELIDEMVDQTRLLTKREMKELFPDCEIRTERMFLLITKSYIAIRR